MTTRQGVLVEVSVLGSVGVRRDGDDVELGARLRRLLAALTVSSGSVVSADRLVDIVWEGDPPAGADKTLRSYVTRLRQAVDSDRDDLIVFRQPGYALGLLPGELDSEVFDDGLDRALQHLRTADATTAAQLLADAIDRWHGPAYAGFADEEWARPESVRLEERLVEAREALIEARLADGLVEQAVADAQALAESQPLRERPRALLMRALYAGGRQAEALRVFSSYRRYLADETGLDPSAEIGELEGRIARNDPGLGGPSQALRGYEMGERIGEGAFAVVHRAVQPGIDRDVAIKVIRAELADQPDFIRRFEFEAQTVARLEHPHVVPLYDYWREPGAAYLVMRWLRGGSVEEALRARGPYTREQVMRLVDDVGGALETAHRAGVVHRDVRPANLLLDVDGTAYLADFGIAVPAATTDDLPIRSPAYAAPEVLRGEPAGVAADVLSLGVTVFELLTGRLPFADSVDRADVIRRQLDEPLPPARATRTDLPPAVDDVLARATAKASGDRYATVAAFVADLRVALQLDAGRPRAELLAGTAGPVENPYVGLHAFDEPDADRFFGREALVAEVVDALERVPLVVVVGASGSGKSSVVRAGVLPAIRRGAVPGSEKWFVTTMMPGPDPIDALETALLRVATNPPATLRTQLAEPGGLLRAIRRVLPDDRARILLVVDQFEELFTQVRDPDERGRFLSELAAAITHPASPLRVVATLRADHYDAPLRHPGMADLVTEGTITVRPMSPEDVERAITLPAGGVGVQVEPALAAELVAGVSVRPTALPLLQFSLTELFDRRVSDVMLLSTHHELGGLTGALAARADRILDAGGPDDEAEVRRIFGRLVTLGEGVEDTRRRALRSEFGDGERTAWLLDAYLTARLLSADRDRATREPTIEVAHEALLRDWPRLRGWLAEDRADLRTLHAISAATDAWIAADRDPGELARGGRLELASDLATRRDDWLNEREREWVETSIAAAEADAAAQAAAIERDRRQNRRLRGLLVAAVGLLVVALVAAVFAFVLRDRATDSEREAVVARTDSDVRRLVVESAAALEEDPDLAILLALEAHDRASELDDETPGEVVAAMQTAIRSSRLVGFVGHEGLALSAAMKPDGSVMAVPALEPPEEIVLYDPATLEVVGRFDAGGEVGHVAFSPDGSMLAVTYFQMLTNELPSDTLGLPPGRLFETEGYTEIASLDGPCCVSATLFSADGGSLAAERFVDSAERIAATTVWDLAGEAPPFELDDMFPLGWLAQSGELVVVNKEWTQLSAVDLATGERRQVVGLDGVEFFGVDTHPSLDRVAVVVGGGTAVQIWEPAEGEPIAEFPLAGTVEDVEFTADGERLIAYGNDDQVMVITLATGEVAVLRGHTGGVGEVDSNVVDDRVVVSDFSGTSRVWELAPAGVADLGEIAAPVVALAGAVASDDGTSLTTVEVEDGLGVVVVRDVAGGERRSTVAFAAPSDVVGLPVVEPRGAVAAGVRDGPAIVVVDTATGEELHRLDGCGEPLAVDPAGSWLVVSHSSCDDSSGAHLVGLGGEDAVHSWDRRIVRSSFGPAGTVAEHLVAVNVQFESIELRRLPSGELLGSFDVDDVGLFFPRFSSDGRHLVFGSQLGGAYVIDVERVLGGESMPDALVLNTPVEVGITNFSGAGGGYLVTTHTGEQLRLWDLETGEERLVLPVESGDFTTVDVSADGANVYYTERGGVVATLPLDFDQLVDLARLRAQRDFTADECERFALGVGCSAMN